MVLPSLTAMSRNQDRLSSLLILLSLVSFLSPSQGYSLLDGFKNLAQWKPVQMLFKPATDVFNCYHHFTRSKTDRCISLVVYGYMENELEKKFDPKCCKRMKELDNLCVPRFLGGVSPAWPHRLVKLCAEMGMT